MNLFKRLLILKFNLGIVAIGFYKVETAKRPIFINFLFNSFSSLILYILLFLFLVVLLQALKIALSLSLISFI